MSDIQKPVGPHHVNLQLIGTVVSLMISLGGVMIAYVKQESARQVEIADLRAEIKAVRSELDAQVKAGKASDDANLSLMSGQIDELRRRLIVIERGKGYDLDGVKRP